MTRVLPLPVMVSLPPRPSNWLKVPLLPMLRAPTVPNVLASYVSLKLVPWIASIERSVSLPTEASPVAVPAPMLTVTAPVEK